MTALPELCTIPLAGGRSPLVSICVTAFNQGAYIDSALRSALEQTYEPLEIVVVDDASSDDTVARVTAHDDTRIRVYVNPRRLGQSANRNRALALTRGQLIKFLDGDDLLEPDCVAKMAQLMVDDPTVGLVFSRSRTVVEESEVSQAWIDEYDERHRQFEAVGTLNDGRALLAEWLSGGLRGNWVGGTEAVMVRRGHVEASGGFGHYLQQALDLDLWTRLFARALVGFVDQPLAAYRWHAGSEREINGRTRRAWLDRLWTLEALAGDPEIHCAYPQITDLLLNERRMVHRTAVRVGHVRHGPVVPLWPYRRYMGFRMMAAVGRRPDLFPALLPIVDPARPKDG